MVVKNRKAKRPKKRDYAAEYARRKARGQKLGLTSSVMRGHPRRDNEGELLENYLNPRAAVLVDARRVFGRQSIPKRGRQLEDGTIISRGRKESFDAWLQRSKGLPGEDIPSYQLRLQEMSKRSGQFNWEDEAAFIREMQGMGATERQAYTFWFSP